MGIFLLDLIGHRTLKTEREEPVKKIWVDAWGAVKNRFLSLIQGLFLGNIELNVREKDSQVWEIILTGGPCGGKTTGKNYLEEKLRDLGFRVILVCEAATSIIGGGVGDIEKIAKTDYPKYLKIQRQIFLKQMDEIRRARATAKIFSKHEKVVILYDRGPMDVLAYMDEDNFWKMVREEGYAPSDIKDFSDGVIHLVTVADGAEEFYTLENNEARRENLEEACVNDKKTQDAWTGCPHLKIIDNSTGFEEKMRRAFRAICRFIGIPVPLEIEKKFLVGEAPDIEHLLSIGAQEISIEQMYLVAQSGRIMRIRKRAQKGSPTYYLTEKVDIEGEPDIRQEKEGKLTARDYLLHKLLRDPKTAVIRKTRYCFVWEYQYFELDVIYRAGYESHEAPVYLLEIELTEKGDKVTIPSFLDVVREVTGEKEFSNYGISRGLHLVAS